MHTGRGTGDGQEMILVREGGGKLTAHILLSSPTQETEAPPPRTLLICSPPLYTETLRRHGVTLKSTVSTIVVTTLVLEGWSSKVRDRARSAVLHPAP